MAQAQQVFRVLAPPLVAHAGLAYHERLKPFLSEARSIPWLWGYRRTARNGSHAGRPRKPGQRTLDHPAVAPQPLAAVNASASNARDDAALAASAAAAPSVIGFVRIQLVRPAPRPAAPALDRHHRVEQLGQRHTVMHVCTGEHKGQRQTMAVPQDVALRARLASVRRVRACGLAPLFAAMDALSMQARLQ